MCVCVCSVENLGLNFRGSGVPALVLFLFYVNVSTMCPWSYLSSQFLRIPATWVLLRVRWSIPLVPWFPG